MGERNKVTRLCRQGRTGIEESVYQHRWEAAVSRGTGEVTKTEDK